MTSSGLGAFHDVLRTKNTKQEPSKQEPKQEPRTPSTWRISQSDLNMNEINENLETLRLAGEEDSDVEDFQEEHQEEQMQPFATQEPERVHSHQNDMALTKKNQ